MDDMDELEWLSQFVEDSFSDYPVLVKPTKPTSYTRNFAIKRETERETGTRFKRLMEKKAEKFWFSDDMKTEDFVVDDLLDLSNEEFGVGDLLDFSNEEFGVDDLLDFSDDEFEDMVSEKLENGTEKAAFSDFDTQLCIPMDDVANLEWLSQFVEDSFPDCTLMVKPTKPAKTAVVKTAKNAVVGVRVPTKPRSKRRRTRSTGSMIREFLTLKLARGEVFGKIETSSVQVVEASLPGKNVTFRQRGLDIRLAIGENKFEAGRPNLSKRIIDETYTEETDDPITGAETSSRDTSTEESEEESETTVKSEFRMTVKAYYGDAFITIQLSDSSGIEALQEQVSQSFKLENGTYIIKYEDEENDPVRIECDEDVHEYISCSTSLGVYVLSIELRRST